MAAWSTDQNKQFDRGRLCDAKLLSSEDKYFACTVFALFFPLVFFCCLSYFSALPTKIAEAGMKGESFLDAPDA